MQPYQILKSINLGLGTQIIQELREVDENTFKTTLLSLAHKKKLRPIFVQRKTREDQATWIFKTISIKLYDDVAEYILQIWLLRARNPMLCSFLDGMDIEHDGNGSTELIPEELPADKLKPTVDKLLTDYPAVEVSIYLRMFQLQKENGYPSLTTILKDDTRLHLEAV